MFAKKHKNGWMYLNLLTSQTIQVLYYQVDASIGAHIRRELFGTRLKGEHHMSKWKQYVWALVSLFWFVIFSHKIMFVKLIILKSYPQFIFTAEPDCIAKGDFCYMADLPCCEGLICKQLDGTFYWGCYEKGTSSFLMWISKWSNCHKNTDLNNYVSISLDGPENTTPAATTPSWTTPGTITFR